jgi:hypothetical protein
MPAGTHPTAAAAAGLLVLPTMQFKTIYPGKHYSPLVSAFHADVSDGSTCQLAHIRLLLLLGCWAACSANYAAQDSYPGKHHLPLVSAFHADVSAGSTCQLAHIRLLLLLLLMMMMMMMMGCCFCQI